MLGSDTRTLPDAALLLRHDPAEMVRLADWIDDRVASLGLAGRPAYAVRLCLEEAVGNVMMHSALPPGLPAGIAVRLHRVGEGLEIVIEDHGAPFDPLTAAPPTTAGSLAEAQVGGLGIALMRRFARAITYRRDGTVNRLTMQFDIEAR